MGDHRSLAHDKVNAGHSETQNAGRGTQNQRLGWFQRIGTAAVLSLAMALPAIGCGARTGLENDDLARVDGGADAIVQVDGGRKEDAGTDAVVDGGTCSPERIMRRTCEIVEQGRHGIAPLIAEYGDRTNEDRQQDGYLLATEETSHDAQPFSDGMGGAVEGGTRQEGLHRIDGEISDSFADVNIEDRNAGANYREEQAVWIRTENMYRDLDDAVGGRVRNFIYQVKFSSNFGIPVCSRSEDGNWASCRPGSEDALAMHDIRIRFLNQDWVITSIEPPEIYLNNETQVVSGGVVRLATVTANGLVNVGESLTGGDGYPYSVKLEAIRGNFAVIKLLDSCGNIISQFDPEIEVTQGETVTLDGIGDDKIRVRVGRISPAGVDIAILEDELGLGSGQAPVVNGRVVDDPYLKVILAWKNYQLGADNRVDYLRSILLFRDGSTDWLQKGNRVDLQSITPAFHLVYRGLDLDPTLAGDYGTLTYAENDGSFSYTADGSVFAREAVNVRSYLTIESTDRGSFSTPQGTGNRLVVVFGDGTNRDAELSIGDSGFEERPTLMPGDVLLKLENEKYVYVGSTNEPGSNLHINYGGAGGFVSLAYGDAAGQFNTYPDGRRVNDSFVIVVNELAGEGLSSGATDSFGFHYDIGNRSFNRDVGVYARDRVRYSSVSAQSEDDAFGPESGLNDGVENREVNYITERGSIIRDATETNVTVKVARRPAHAEFLMVEERCE